MKNTRIYVPLSNGEIRALKAGNALGSPHNILNGRIYHWRLSEGDYGIHRLSMSSKDAFLVSWVR